MKKLAIGFLSGLALATIAAYAAVNADIIWWGYGGSNYVKEWVESSGRMGQQSLVNSGSTAITLWPTSGTRPTTDSISELTLYRTMWSDATMERFNISAMATADGAAYRFGVEKSGTGSVYRDMIFCFENTGGGAGGATCNLKITTAGVYVSDDGGATWRQL